MKNWIIAILLMMVITTVMNINFSFNENKDNSNTYSSISYKNTILDKTCIYIYNLGKYYRLYWLLKE